MTSKLTFEERILFDQIAADFDKRPTTRGRRSDGVGRLAAAAGIGAFSTVGMVVFVQLTLVAFVFAVSAAAASGIVLTDTRVRALGRRFLDSVCVRAATRRTPLRHRPGFF